MYLFNKYVFSAYYVPGPGLGTGDTVRNKTIKKKNSHFCGTSILAVGRQTRIDEVGDIQFLLGLVEK